jgi:hypothetical protein
MTPKVNMRPKKVNKTPKVNKKKKLLSELTKLKNRLRARERWRALPAETKKEIINKQRMMRQALPQGKKEELLMKRRQRYLEKDDMNRLLQSMVANVTGVMDIGNVGGITLPTTTIFDIAAMVEIVVKRKVNESNNDDMVNITPNVGVDDGKDMTTAGAVESNNNATYDVSPAVPPPPPVVLRRSTRLATAAANNNNCSSSTRLATATANKLSFVNICIIS